MNAHILLSLQQAEQEGAELPRPFVPARSARFALWAGALLVALLAFLQWGTGVHNDFTQNVWLPARLVLDGTNPYNPSRAEVDAALGAYSSRFEDFNSGERYFFIYPMWVALIFLPLGMLPLTLAMALWQAANVILLAWAAAAVLRTSGTLYQQARTIAGVGLVLVVVLCFVYRETITTLDLGQFSIIEFALLAGIWSRLASARPETGQRLIHGDILVGLALAVLATKPQSVGLAVLLLGLWAISRRRFIVLGSAAVSLLVLLVGPLFLYPSSLGDWLSVIIGGQAGSQAAISASVWGVSYAIFGPGSVWTWVALALSIAGVILLLPAWWQDLKDKASPLPLSLPITLCVNSIISPYLLGYEQVLLLFPALILLARAGLPGEPGAQHGRYLRLALYTWMVVLPFLLIPLQGQAKAEYPLIVQAVTLLAIYFFARPMMRAVNSKS